MSDYVKSQIGEDIRDKRQKVYDINLNDEDKTKLNIIKNIALYVAVNLGKGRDEGVYQRALCHELQKNNILYNAEETIPIMYDGIGVGYERLDIIIYSWNGVPFKMVLELKATTKIENKYHWQILSYMNYKQCNFGAVINFNQGVQGQPLEFAYLIKLNNKPYIYSLTKEEGISMNTPNYENGVVDDLAIIQVEQLNKALKDKALKDKANTDAKVLKDKTEKPTKRNKKQ